VTSIVNWRAVLSFIHSWQWLIGAIAVAVPVVYSGPRKVLETWDWYVDRFRDQPVLNAMRDGKLVPRHLTIPLMQPIGPSFAAPTQNTLIVKEGTYSVGDLANILHRTHRSIGKSVRRLKAKGKIELIRGGFKVRENLPEK
jgi:hypothetical protein